MIQRLIVLQGRDISQNEVALRAGYKPMASIVSDNHKDINTFMVEVLYYESVDFFRKENNIGAGSGKQTLSNKEKCMMLIDSFDEGQLLNIAAMLQAARDAIDEALDDSFCNRLYEEYLNDPDPEKNESVSIQDLATELGISL